MKLKNLPTDIVNEILSYLKIKEQNNVINIYFPKNKDINPEIYEKIKYNNINIKDNKKYKNIEIDITQFNEEFMNKYKNRNLYGLHITNYDNYDNSDNSNISEFHNLRKLSLHYCKGLTNINLGVMHIPNNLLTLEIYAGYRRQLLKIENLPKSLSALILRCSVSKLENLPEGLQELELSCYDIKKLENLPKSLRVLKLIGNYENNIINANSIKNLPSCMRTLWIGYMIIPSIDNLPENLRELYLHSSVIKSFKSIPKNLEKLDLCYTMIKKISGDVENIGDIFNILDKQNNNEYNEYNEYNEKFRKQLINYYWKKKIKK